jgi:formiminoglutamase
MRITNLISAQTSEVSKLIAQRKGETKSGSLMAFPPAEDSYYRDNLYRFVVLGIPEDIGPRANKGRGGSWSMWNEFLPKFLNIQANDFWDPKTIAIAGTVECSDLMKMAEQGAHPDWDQLVRELDKRVMQVLDQILQNGAIPIIIGGGHNNAYPIISSVSNKWKSPLHVVNIDPHADLRSTEIRHSGNGFSFALQEQKLKKYFVCGLHENYNNSYILDQFKDSEHLGFFSFDDFLRGRFDLDEKLKEVISFIGPAISGLEIDLDAVAGFPSSAETLSGFTANDVRSLIFKLSEALDFRYLHITEGAPVLSQGDQSLHGKTVAYFVTDFIKTIQNKHPKRH